MCADQLLPEIHKWNQLFEEEHYSVIENVFGEGNLIQCFEKIKAETNDNN